MPLSSKRPEPTSSPLRMAGWLFADLAVILMVIFLAVGTDHPAEAQAEPEPTPSPTATQEEPVDTGMSVDPVKKTIKTNTAKLRAGDDKALAKLLDKEFGDLAEDGEMAAVVLTFGGGSDPDVAVATAKAANKVLRDTLPDLMELVSKEGTRDFWDGGLSSNQIRFEVFFHVTELPK